MSIFGIGRRLWAGLFLVIMTLTGARVDAETVTAGGSAQRRVMAFYYPWYGTPDGPGGAGRSVHWERIDVEKKDIAASTHYPALGAYDSHRWRSCWPIVESYWGTS